MKHDYKTQEKALYGTGRAPVLLTAPPQQYIQIKGRGNPNGDDFAQRVGVLYSVAYPIKMRHKAFCASHPAEGAAFPFRDYSVYPLEGLWSSASEDHTDKDQYIYTIMIRQPDFITSELYAEALSQAMRKKPHPLLEEVAFGPVEDGLSLQILHVGPFDDEPASFAKMDAWAAENGYAREGYFHREIYLTDARKSAPEKRRTLLRYPVQKTGAGR